MDLKKLKLLLEKYYEGETSLEEEKILKEFFGQEGLLEENFADKEILGFFNSDKTHLPTNFDQELKALIEDEFKNNPKRRFLKIIKWSGSIAAAIIIAIGIFEINFKEQPHLYVDTYKDRDKAYKETEQVLLFISQTMNHKAKGLKYLANVDNSLKQINKLSKIDESLNSIKNENN
jgi:hypothetical protein